MYAHAYSAVHDKRKHILYIHATDILPAVILSLNGVYILVRGKKDRFGFFRLPPQGGHFYVPVLKRS